MQELTLLKRSIVDRAERPPAATAVDDVFLVLTEGRVAAAGPAAAAPARRARRHPRASDLDALPAPLRASFGGVLDAWQRRARTPLDMTRPRGAR